jgi:transposase
MTIDKKKKSTKSITPEEFVRVFIEKQTFEEIAKEFNISVSSVKNRAYALKRSGVNLNTKKKSAGCFFGSATLDEKNVKELNNMINDFNNK